MARVDVHRAEGEVIGVTGLHAAIVARRDNVGGAKVGGEALLEGVIHALGLPQDHGNALRAEAVAIELHLFGNGVERFIPGNPGPQVAASFSCPFHWKLQALPMTMYFRNGARAFGRVADVAMQATTRVGNDLDDLAVFESGGQRAVAGANETKNSLLCLHDYRPLEVLKRCNCNCSNGKKSLMEVLRSMLGNSMGTCMYFKLGAWAMMFSRLILLPACSRTFSKV